MTGRCLLPHRNRLALAAGLLVLVLAIPGSEGAAAQPAVPWSLSGEVRHRSEVDAKAFGADPAAPVFHLLRTRLGVAVQPSPGVDVFVQLQDARVFGGGDPARGRGTLDGAAQALDLHQAYFTVHDLFGAAGLTVQVGRQELAYGNERLLGAVGWSNVGRTFDAGVLRYGREAGGGALQVDLLAAKLVDGLQAEEAQNLVGLYGTFAGASGPSLDAFVWTWRCGTATTSASRSPPARRCSCRARTWSSCWTPRRRTGST